MLSVRSCNWTLDFIMKAYVSFKFLTQINVNCKKCSIVVILFFLNSRQSLCPKILKTHLPKIWPSYANALGTVFHTNINRLGAKKNSLVSSGSFKMIINLLIYSSLPYCRGRGRALKYIFGQISPPVSFHWALLLKEFDLKRLPFFKDLDRFH